MMTSRGMDGRAGGFLPTCGWCGRYCLPPAGRILRLLARGRSMCSGCGRYQVECSCETNVHGRSLLVPVVVR